MNIDVECSAQAQQVFHALKDVRCSWPVPDSDGATVAVTGAVPDVLHPESAELQVGTGRLPAATLLDWLRVASARVPPDLKAQGFLSASLSHAASPDQSASAAPVWSGQATLSDVALASPQLGDDPFLVDSLTLAVPRGTPATPLRADLKPALLSLGGMDPALLEGSVGPLGYTVHLSGSVLPSRLVALTQALPHVADGLAQVLPRPRAPAPVYLDLSAFRPWGGTQVWTDHLAAEPVPVARKARRH